MSNGRTADADEDKTRCKSRDPRQYNESSDINDDKTNVEEYKENSKYLVANTPGTFLGLVRGGVVIRNYSQIP